MKPYSLLSLMAAALVVAGCSTTHSSKSTAPAAAAPAAASSFDTSKLVAAFAHSDVDSNQIVNAVVQDVSAKNYKGAASELQKLARIPGLTASQESSVKQLAGQLATKMGM